MGVGVVMLEMLPDSAQNLRLVRIPAKVISHSGVK